MTTVYSRAASGAALLDEKRPGWTAAVNVAALAKCGVETCVLAQLYGSYADGLCTLFADPYDGEAYGFTEAQGDWSASAACWRAEVLARKMR